MACSIFLEAAEIGLAPFLAGRISLAGISGTTQALLANHNKVAVAWLQSSWAAG